MIRPVTEYHDIQAIVRTGFGRLEEAAFLLLRVARAAEARQWLAALIEPPGAGPLAYRLTLAGDLKTYQAQAIQVAFTAAGLRQIGLPEDLVKTFSREFYLGEATGEAEREGRPLRLGDVDANAPSKWDWGGPHRIPDLLVMLYAETGRLAAFKDLVCADLAPGFELLNDLETARMADDDSPRREPFGFVDGLSQPEVDWEAKRTPATRADVEYGNSIAAGEFLLGYPNEYGFLTQRPLVDPGRDPEKLLPPADDMPDKRDLGRNGTYLVLRQLEQDVTAFWNFVAAQSPADGGVALAEAMVGRRLASGDPLVPAAAAPIRGVGPESADLHQNGFTFDGDPDGLACPFGAHIRRANPRNGDMPGGRQSLLSWLLRTLGLKRGGPRDDLISSSRFHRILRRGRTYGMPAARARAAKGEYPASKMGLHFIALNANISRQFEFIQNAWMVNSKFDGLTGESDPLLGSRAESPLGQPSCGFSVPQASGCDRRIGKLPQFVTVVGSAYFFLPGLRALRFLTRQTG